MEKELPGLTIIYRRDIISAKIVYKRQYIECTKKRLLLNYLFLQGILSFSKN